jgi:hypothetical protein
VSFSIPENLLVPSRNIISLTIDCEFEKALKSSDSLILLNPEDPLPLVLKLATIGLRDVDFEQTIDSVLFLDTYKIAIGKIREYEKTHSISSYSRTLEGLSKSFHATFYLRNKQYIGVLQNGIDALKLLQDAKKLDPSNTEVDFFLGLYDYGKSELKKKLWWVLFWYPGSKKDGIRQLNACSKTAYLTNKAAMLSLVDIYVQEKQLDLSYKTLNILEAEHLESRFVLWGKTKFFEAQKKYGDAAIIYKKLSLQYASIPEGQHNFFVTKSNYARMLNLSGNSADAMVACKSLLAEKNIDQHKNIKRDTQRLLEDIEDDKI